MSWIEYKDASMHSELTVNAKYCVRTEDGNEFYAKFVVYEGGEECDFISLNDNRSIGRISAFRHLDKSLDFPVNN